MGGLLNLGQDQLAIRRHNFLKQILSGDIPTKDLVAWFKATDGVTLATGVSAWADQSGLGHDLIQATAANQPVYLDYSGTKYSYHPGVAGNNVSTPNAAANRITGDIDIRWYGKIDVLPSTAYKTLVNKFSPAVGQYSYYFSTDNANHLYLNTTGNGSTSRNYSSTVTLASVGITSNVYCGLRVTRVASTGAITFFYDLGAGWVQLGATVAGASGAIFAGNSAVSIGEWVGYSSPFSLAGRTYRAQIYGNNVSGDPMPLRVDYNPGDWTSGTTFPSATTGETWTINSTGSRPCQIVDYASLLGNGSTHKMAAAYAHNQPITRVFVGRQITHTVGDVLIDGASALTAALKQTGVSPELSIDAGTAVAANSNAALGAWKVFAMKIDGANSSLEVNNTTPTTGNAGAGNPGGITLFADGAGANYGNFQVREIADYAASLTPTEIAVIKNILAARNGVTL